LAIEWRIIGLGVAVGGRHVEAFIWGFPASSCEDKELMNDEFSFVEGSPGRVGAN